MNKIIIFLLTCIFLGACYSADDLPTDIIKPTEMKNILWDVMSAQSLASEISMKDSLVNQAAETKELSHRVFKIHHIDSASFNKSYNWYVKHPDILKRIFDSLYAQKERENVSEFKPTHQKKIQAIEK
ncbi:MAG: DUF4296 domain-containing protein [Ginsengibacter sp.]